MLRLVSDAKNAWKWISMWCMSIGAALQGAWTFIPDDMRTTLDPRLVHILTMVLLLLGIAGRLIDQKPRHDDEDHKEDHP